MVWFNDCVNETFNKHILSLTFVSFVNRNMPDYSFKIKVCNSLKTYK